MSEEEKKAALAEINAAEGKETAPEVATDTNVVSAVQEKDSNLRAWGRRHCNVYNAVSQRYLQILHDLMYVSACQETKM